MADIETTGPEKREGFTRPHEMPDEERIGKREAGRTDVEKEAEPGRGTNLERSGTSDAVRDYREYGEGVTQNE